MILPEGVKGQFELPRSLLDSGVNQRSYPFAGLKCADQYRRRSNIRRGDKRSGVKADRDIVISIPCVMMNLKLQPGEVF